MGLVQRDRTVHIGWSGTTAKGTSWVALSARLRQRARHGEGRASKRVCSLVDDREVDRGIVCKRQDSAVIRVDLVGHVLQLTGERSRVMVGLSDPVGCSAQSVAA